MDCHTTLRNLSEGARVIFNNRAEEGTLTPELEVERVVIVRDEDNTLRVDFEDPCNNEKYSVESHNGGERIFISKIGDDGLNWYTKVHGFTILAGVETTTKDGYWACS